MTRISFSGKMGRLAFTLFAVSLVSGCYMSVHPKMDLYAVRGPATTETPVREGNIRFAAHAVLTPVYFSVSKSGKITAMLGDGEICKGQWRMLSTPADNPMASDWDAIYGQGFYVAHVLGARQYMQAKLTGAQGTKLDVEMYWPETGDRDQATPGSGVATDSHGNVYKVAQHY